MAGLGRIGKGKGDRKRRLFRPEDGGMRAGEAMVGAGVAATSVLLARPQTAWKAGREGQFLPPGPCFRGKNEHSSRFICLAGPQLGMACPVLN